jgi:hypothetical protein
MSLNVDPPDIYYERDLMVVEQRLLESAAELAILGQIAIARDMVSLYFAETQGRSAYYRTQLRGLNYAWRITGQWPEQIPPEEKAVETFEHLPWKYENRWEKVPDEAKVVSEAGLNKFLKLLDEGERGNDHFRGLHLVRALDMSLAIYEEQNKDIPWMKDRSLPASCADLDATSRHLCEQVVEKLDTKGQVEYLTEVEDLWPYMLQGLFTSAEASPITPNQTKEQGLALLEAFKGRIFTGCEPSHLKDKSLLELLKLGEKNTITGPGKTDRERYGAESPTALFKEPATAAQISDLEQKLETTLPEDYKAFLLLTNGFSTDTNAQNGIFNTYYPDPGLCATTEVAWWEEPYYELPVELLEISRELEHLGYDGKLKYSSGNVLEWSTPLPLFTRILDIGHRDVENVWLVHPDVVREAREAYKGMREAAIEERQRRLLDRAVREFCGGWEAFEELEWACCRWSSGGAANLVCYPSFRKYLEVLVESSGEKR